MADRTFVDTHGVEVFSRWWIPQSPLALLLVSHGASEHSGRYTRFAQALNAQGIAVVAVDHRGHGLTGRPSHVGVMGKGGGDAIIEDLHQLRTLAQAEVGDIPVLLFGHSLGSLIAVAYLSRFSEGLAGAVCCGHPFDPGDVEGVAELFSSLIEQGLGDQPADSLFDEFNKPFEPARTPFDWLSRDQAEVDAYISDPMCGPGNPLTYGFLAELAKSSAPAFHRLDAISCPVLVIAGEQDPAGAQGSHPSALDAALREAGVDSSLRLYPEDRHEILNELDRDQVTAQIIEWVKNH